MEERLENDRNAARRHSLPRRAKLWGRKFRAFPVRLSTFQIAEEQEMKLTDIGAREKVLSLVNMAICSSIHSYPSS